MAQQAVAQQAVVSTVILLTIVPHGAGGAYRRASAITRPVRNLPPGERRRCPGC
ncbi:MAG: hypothetical protein JO132_10635 [Streptosporangiaceae bacterium]|nr:hypothetical protein [Streptosporangiaceae bacterium]